MASTFTILQAGQNPSFDFQVNMNTLFTQIKLLEAHIYGDPDGVTLNAVQVSDNDIQIDISSTSISYTEIPLTVSIEFGEIETGDYFHMSLTGQKEIINAWTDPDLIECVLPTSIESVISYDMECVKEKSPYFQSSVEFTHKDFPSNITLVTEIIGTFK